ncbi:hypothetical protein INT47_009683 [Mucor saturninus]|uniref:Uncharacterized protein n=1 Tax=Mucor saturninus TaxID=64648 RepID=A0A8H7UW47_9FUNG|nr:hypothetical protein INT47_009683 [Mucor saturninus]
MSSNQRNSGRKARANPTAPIHRVAAGRISQREILPRAPSSSEESSQGQTEMATVLEDLRFLKSRMGMVYDIAGKTNQTMSTFMEAHASGVQSQLPLGQAGPVGMAPSVGPSSSLGTSDMSAIVLEFINEKMWKKNFTSNDPALIAENEGKQKWNKDKKINHPDNVRVINYLRDYILSQPRAAGFWPGMVVQKIKNNYKYYHLTSNMSEEQASAKKRKVRANTRLVEIHLRRVEAYKRHWRAIDEEMGHKPENPDEMAYLHVLQKDVMSDGESDMEDVAPGISMRVLCVARPSWRSDELNRLLEVIDHLAREDDLRRSSTKTKTRMPRQQKTIKEIPAPSHLTLNLPAWVFKNE